MGAVFLVFVISGAFAPVGAETSHGPSVECPPATVTLQTLISMLDVRGPLSTRYNTVLNERALECVGGGPS